MKQFNFYSHPHHGHRAVKKGFSWPGCFFTGIWALLCTLWLRGAVIIVILMLPMCTLDVMVAGMEDNLQSSPDDGTWALLFMLLFLLPWVVGIVVGLKGNAWKTQSLENQGFTLQGTVAAENPQAALAKLSTGG